MKYLFVIAVILGSILVSLLYHNNLLLTREKRQSVTSSLGGLDKYREDKVPFDKIIDNNRIFNITGDDLLVLLHIQKTAGTAFENHLVFDLKIDKPCACNDNKRRCRCPRPNWISKPQTVSESTWLISRFSIGWACGLHSDWTQLTYCLRGLNNLFFTTILRNPVDRFVSEFRHVQRGATWKTSKNHCEGYNTQLCLGNRSTWLNVTLGEFMDCPYNMAINRQTRMLADHKIESCIITNNSSIERDRAMLKSAMENLRQTSFFGLCEKQRLSQLVFEKTFNLTFDVKFRQSEDNKTKIFIDALPNETRDKIIKLNHLDMKLYNYANELMLTRCRRLFEDCRKVTQERSPESLN